MDQNFITIKFVTNSQVEDRHYIISRDVIKKYPNSFFNFCQDFDNNTLEFNTDIINYDEFRQVLDLINGVIMYSSMTNASNLRFFIIMILKNPNKNFSR